MIVTVARLIPTLYCWRRWSLLKLDAK